MNGLMEGRLPQSVRIHRALALAVDELGTGSLEDVISLASAICNLTVWEDTAIEYFRSEPGEYQLTNDRGRTVVRLRPK